MSPEDSTLSEDQFSGRDNEGDNSDDATYDEGKVADQEPTQPPRKSPLRGPQGTIHRRPAEIVPQGTPRKVVPQGLPAPKTSPPVRRAPHPANTPLPTNTSPPAQGTSPPVKKVPPPSHPTNPFKEGTKKFNVAQRLIAGETDRKKIARELGVSIHTLYTVASDLRAHGYNIPGTSTVYTPSTSTKAESQSPQSHSPTPQQRPQGDIEGTSSEDRPQAGISPEDVQTRGYAKCGRILPWGMSQEDSTFPRDYEEILTGTSPRYVPRESI